MYHQEEPREGGKRVKKRIIAGAALGGLALALVVPTAAQAHESSEQPGFVAVAWHVQSNDPTQPWANGGQVLAATHYSNTPTLSLDQFTEGVVCNTVYQVDVYVNSEQTAALVAGGVLLGPSNPLPEHFPVYEEQSNPPIPGWPWGTSFHAMVTSAACEDINPTLPPSPPVEPPAECPAEAPIRVEDGSCVPETYFPPTPVDPVPSEEPGELIPPVSSEQPAPPAEPAQSPPNTANVSNADTFAAPAPSSVATPTAVPTLPRTGLSLEPLPVTILAVAILLLGIGLAVAQNIRRRYSKDDGHDDAD